MRRLERSHNDPDIIVPILRSGILAREFCRYSVRAKVIAVFERSIYADRVDLRLLRMRGATQHSLPSGRYSLLGPDLHRLDRTSFRLAHLFDYLIGERKQLVRNLEPKRLGGFRLITNWYFVGNCTGRSPGFSPRRIRSM